MVFPNQLHDAWFWPLGASLATKHRLVVFVHWPLLWLVRIASRDNASKLYQSTPERQNMPHPSGSLHRGFAEFSASGGIGSSGWKEAAGPTSSSMQGQFQSQTSQASYSKDGKPTMTLSTRFTAEPLSTWTLFFLVRIFSQNFPCCYLWSLPLTLCCAPLWKVWLHLPCNSPPGSWRQPWGLPVPLALSSLGFELSVRTAERTNCWEKNLHWWQRRESCPFYWNRCMPS